MSKQWGPPCVFFASPCFFKIRNLVSREKGPIVIENDTWLGTGVIVMPNIHIMEGAVIAVASVVTRDAPS